MDSGGSRYNNDERIANSVAKSAVKLVYYYAFATLYGLAGGWANVSARCCVSMLPPLTASCRWAAAKVAQTASKGNRNGC